MDVPFLVRDHPVEHRVLFRAGAHRVEDRAGTTAVCEINQPCAGPGRSSTRTKVSVAVLPDVVAVSGWHDRAMLTAEAT